VLGTRSKSTKSPFPRKATPLLPETAERVPKVALSTMSKGRVVVTPLVRSSLLKP